MKGKIRDTVSKWWVLVLVATLALSLTSCGMKRSSWLNSGNGQDCEGNDLGKPSMGYFGWSVSPYGNNTLALYINVYEPAIPGDHVSVALLGNGTVIDLGGDHILVAGDQFFAGIVMESQWQTIDTISIEDAHPGSFWETENPAKVTECILR